MKSALSVTTESTESAQAQIEAADALFRALKLEELKAYLDDEALGTQVRGAGTRTENEGLNNPSIPSHSKVTSEG